MAYPHRQTPPGVVFHVLNRAVQRQMLFRSADDYRAFLRCVWEAKLRHPVDLYVYCVMPNHFHFVLAAREERQASRFMALLTGTHSKRWHVARGSVGTGSVYQGRFKAFPIQTEAYFYAACRYVEGNALRAGLVSRAEEWPWSSLRPERGAFEITLAPWPLDRPADWLARVNEPLPTLSEVRKSVRTGQPLGSCEWASAIAERLGLPSKRHPKTTSEVVL